MTLGPRTRELLTIASAATGPPPVAPGAAGTAGRLGGELAELLAARNGWYAFESALHVFGSGSAPDDATTLEEWNAPRTWRDAYAGLADGFLFFAEDAFGNQFAIRDETVHTFEPETGDTAPMASSIEDWADQLLADYAVLTGYPLAHDWQVRHGVLRPGQRLLPKTPFVFGGEYAVDNLYTADSVEGMRFRGDVAVQIRDLPDGAQVEFRVVD